MPCASSRSSWMVSCTSSRQLVEHLVARGRVVGDDVAGQAEVDGQGDQVLLGAVVEVALDPAPLGVAAGDDPGPRLAQVVGLLAQLVERGLERGVELGVVEGQADLAGQVGEHAVVVLGEGVRAAGALDHDQPEQLAARG